MAFFEGHKMTAGYGNGPDIISSCSINVNRGEVVAILGPNGAGKSTAMKAMLGLLNLKSGSVYIDGKDISNLSPQDRVKQGISFVPQTRNVFAELTVKENLEVGAFLREDDIIKVSFPKDGSNPEDDPKVKELKNLIEKAKGDRENAEKAVEGGADFLKILASGAVLAFDGVPGAPEMTQEEIAAVVSVARNAGIKVTSHAHGAQSIKDSILAGVDSIEHASLADQESIELAASHDVAFSMDVYNGDHARAVGEEEGWPDEFMRKMNETTDAQRDVFSRALAAGVPITFGTDAAVYPHGDNARQFSIMVRHGMSPMQAIKSATSIAAKYIGWGEKVGSIKKNFLGDLIAIKKNPLEDISVLENVDIVVKGGIVVKGMK